MREVYAVQVIVVGLNYRTAPVEVRERFALSEADLPQALASFKATAGIREGVIVSTCNRTELYAVADRPMLCGYSIRSFMERWFGLPRQQFNRFLYMYEDGQAVEHLFRVACGLDSMVLGETQILGQVRNAFLLAQRQGTTGTIFNRLFKQAITLAKRAHHATSIGENAVSVSYAAVELGRRIFRRFDGKRVMLVGAGKMGALAARHLQAHGATDIVVANRTLDRARELAETFGGVAKPLDELPALLQSVDIVISSTNAPGQLITAEMVRAATADRTGRPLVLIDIAVPRDIDPGCADVPGVFLYDIDDLEGIVEDNLAKRRQDSEVIGAMIAEEREAFAQWTATLSVQPVIRSLQEKAAAIHEATVQSLLQKLPGLDERQEEKIRKLTKSMISQLLREPIVRLKDMATEGRGESAARLLAELFALGDAVGADERAEADPVADWDRAAADGARRKEASSDSGASDARPNADASPHVAPIKADRAAPSAAREAEPLPRLAGAIR